MKTPNEDTKALYEILDRRVAQQVKANSNCLPVGGYKVLGLKNSFIVSEVDHLNQTITVNMSNVTPGKTYCEEDLV